MSNAIKTNALSPKGNVLAYMRSKMPTKDNRLSKEMLLTDWTLYWLEYLTPDIKLSTRNTYQSAVDNHINRVFEGIKLCDLTSEDVQLFVISLIEGVDLDDPLGSKSVRNVHGVLHGCLQSAYEMKLIPENPAKHTNMPRIKKTEIVPMNTAQLMEFLRAVTGHPLEVFFKLAVLTGMRKSELIGLTWDCFHFDDGFIRLYRQLSYNKTKRHYYFESLKNGKPRTIYPPAAVMEMMEQYYRRKSSGNFVFPGPSGGDHLTPSQIRKPFDRIIARMDLPKFRFHDLRHTYAVLSLKAGVDLKTLSESMGHYSVAFTLDTYAFALSDMKQESARRLQSYIDEQNFSI